MAYVSEYGNWGTEAVFEFDSDALTEKQWELLTILPDNDKFDYAIAVVNGEDTSDWE